MKRIQIIKNGIEAFKIEDTEEVVLKWLEDGLAHNWFGKPAVFEERMNEETLEIYQFEVQPAEVFTVVGPIDITEEFNQRKINEEARAYLALTDWYAIRFSETGEPIPGEIVTLRAQARASVVHL